MRQKNKRGLHKFFHEKITSEIFILRNIIDQNIVAKLVIGPDFKEFTQHERIYNGIKEWVTTLGLTLLIFTIMFAWFLDPRATVQEMEDHRLIANKDELYPAMVSINNNMLLIVVTFFALPLSCFCILKIKQHPARNDEVTPV